MKCSRKIDEIKSMTFLCFRTIICAPSSSTLLCCSHDVRKLTCKIQLLPSSAWSGFFFKLITQQKNKHSFFSSYCSFFLEMYTEIPASFLTNTTEAQPSKQKNTRYFKKDYIQNIKGLFYTYVISFWSI